jgi:hypothetical protein
VTALEGENVQLRTENATLKKERIAGEVKNFMEKLKPGVLLPKFARGITELLVDLKAAGQEINFSETEKKPAVDLLMEFIESYPVQIPTKEVGKIAGVEGDERPAEYAEGTVDEDRLDLHMKAKALQKKEKITYPEALGRITKGGK